MMRMAIAAAVAAPAVVGMAARRRFISRLAIDWIKRAGQIHWIKQIIDGRIAAATDAGVRMHACIAIAAGANWRFAGCNPGSRINPLACFSSLLAMLLNVPVHALLYSLCFALSRWHSGHKVMRYKDCTDAKQRAGNKKFHSISP